MFYQYNCNSFHKVEIEDIDPEIMTAGYVDVKELLSVYDKFGFSQTTVEACKVANKYFRSGVEVYDDYTFTELRIIQKSDKDEDCVALYLKKNLVLVVDVEDHDGSTKNKFMYALRRYTTDTVTLEKVIYAFLDCLVGEDFKVLEDISVELSDMEEALMDEKVEKNFNATLLRKKKMLSRFHNYYEQILDIADTIYENENGIFDSESLMYISNITKKVERLKEDIDSLKNSVEHLQDAYSSFLDIKMNSTMKIFTVLTSVFFPLTIIVGWYGMNFESMPEFHWKYGYLYVILLSLTTVLILTVVGKKKKWF